ncbi:sugar phosphate isomerase/epimerase family protein [Bryobacter aggregatus]|uniref:sugar phosphate isomerase/epimerase family protein n=1 Tax=Bryobacter aggregatus TaxID=360054 RepID=UPI0006916D1E|nr:sugar phosphate isomerase/epimerase family protein [Bryobacter aggregatus]
MLTRRSLLATVPLALSAKAKPRLRPALCAYSFRQDLQKGTLKYEDLIGIAADNDLDGVDLTVYWFPNTEDSFLMPLKRAAYKAGIEIYSISIRTELTRPAGPERDKMIADIKKWVDVAEKLGAGHIRVFGGPIPKNSTEDEAAGWVAETLLPAADYAGKHGVILGLENHHGVTDRADTIVKIVKKVNSPWVGVNLDTANFPTRIYEQIETIAPYAVNVQVKAMIKDENGPAPSDWDRVAKMLTANNYRGYLALEYEEKEDASIATPPLFKKLREVCARHS